MATHELGKINESGTYIRSFGPDDYSDNLVFIENGRKDIGKAWKYKNGTCNNLNLILEGSFSRLIQNMESKGKAWAIISATKKAEFNFEQNKARNVKLREALRRHGMGVYVLVGHWETQNEDGACAGTVERFFFATKPADMPFIKFEKVMKELMVIDGISQEAVLIRYPKDNDAGHPEGPFIIFADGVEKKLEGKELNLDYITQAYRRRAQKRDIPIVAANRDENASVNFEQNTDSPYVNGRDFKFEGVEVPSGNMGCLVFNEAGLSYMEAYPKQYFRGVKPTVQ